MGTGSLQQVADAFIETVGAAERSWANGGKGMRIPFFGDFAYLPPSTKARLRWWKREFQKAREADALTDEDG